jgi:DNA invertase Pin-like site-specific DNA recombinase
MIKKPIAYSYVRFSTPDQLKGNSLERQLKHSEKYAADHGLELDTSLNLRDLGLSAYHKVNVEKGALGVFLQAVSDGRIRPGSHLLVESLDRLSRAKVEEAQTLFLEIVNAGITIVTVADGMVYTKGGNWTNLVFSLAIMARAHDESEMKSQRVKAAWDKKREDSATKVITSVMPSWLEVIDGKIVVIEEKANVVREIFRLLRSGYGLSMIEAKFNKENVPPITKASRWWSTYMHKMVKGRAVLGEYIPTVLDVGKKRQEGEPIKNYFPAIITEEEYYAVHSAMADRKNYGSGRKGSGVASLFSGICRCGYCGSTMRLTSKSKNMRKRYLLCTKAKSGLGCIHISWPYEDFENCILSKLTGMDIGTVLREVDAEQEKVKLSTELAKFEDIRKRLANLIRIAEVTENIDEIASRISVLKEEEKTTQRTIRELESRSQLPNLGRKHFQQFLKLQEALNSASGDELIELRLRISLEMKRLLIRIEIYPDGDEPWSYGMKLIGVKQGKKGRFAVAIFKSGDGRVLHGANGTATIWPGPKTEEGVATAHILPFAKNAGIRSRFAEGL